MNEIQMYDGNGIEPDDLRKLRLDREQYECDCKIIEARCAQQEARCTQQEMERRVRVNYLYLDVMNSTTTSKANFIFNSTFSFIRY